MATSTARKIPEKAYESLARSLYTSPGTLLASVVVATVATTIASARTGSATLAWFAVAIGFVGFLRLCLQASYLRLRAHPCMSGYGMAPWRRAYLMGGFAFSLTSGMAVMTCIAGHDDAVSAMVMLTCSISYAGAIAGRNSGCPEVSLAQLWGVCAPAVVGLVANGDWPHQMMAAFVACYGVGMGKVTHDLNRMFLEAHLAAEERSDMARKFRLALSSMKHGLVVLDPQGRVEFCSESLGRILRIPQPEPGVDVERVVDACLSAGSGSQVTPRLRSLLARILRSRTHVTREVSLPDGRTISLTVSPKPECGCVVVVDDVTDRVKAAKALAQASRLDALTGLLNRHSLDVEMARLLSAGRPACVVALDLDRFKAVNDTYGHAAGDGLLRAVAERIRSILPDGAVAARLGGDEFVVLCEGGGDTAQSMARAIMATVDRPYPVDGREISVSVSVGTALSPSDGTDGITLMRNADTALYRVKEDGRCGWRPYDKAMDEEFRARQALEADLRTALDEDVLEVAFQPQLNLASGTVTACEALVRWNHPTRGAVPPDAFVPLAEQTGLIHRIGLVVLERACVEAAGWPAHVKVAVNLSPVQFRHDIAAAVREILERTGFPGSRLELEVTESVLMEDRDDVMAAFIRLAALGVSIALDDFGTGYSSLSYLRSFPFRKVKLDRSFVRGLSDGPESLAIIRAMARLGRDLGMDVVVEGVETESDLETVSATDCTTVQGYLLSRPLPPAETLGFLNARVARARAA